MFSRKRKSSASGNHVAAVCRLQSGVRSKCEINSIRFRVSIRIVCRFDFAFRSYHDFVLPKSVASRAFKRNMVPPILVIKGIRPTWQCDPAWQCDLHSARTAAQPRPYSTAWSRGAAPGARAPGRQTSHCTRGRSCDTRARAAPSTLSNTKGCSSTFLALRFANVRAGTWYPPEH